MEEEKPTIIDRVKHAFTAAKIAFQNRDLLADAAFIQTLDDLGNDLSRPPVPSQGKFPDFTAELKKLDTTKPVGIFIFSVEDNGLMPTVQINVSRNNFIDEMRKHYGDNFITVDIPTGGFTGGFYERLASYQWSHLHLKDFVEQFNNAVADSPQLHIVANHHQDTFDDGYLAQALVNLKGHDKRAMILACGPESKHYELPGFQYVMIPRPDGQVLGPQLDTRPSPGYRYTIEWMRHEADPQAIRDRLGSWTDIRNYMSEAVDRGGQMIYHGIDAPYLPPVVKGPAADGASSYVEGHWPDTPIPKWARERFAPGVKLNFTDGPEDEIKHLIPAPPSNGQPKTDISR